MIEWITRSGSIGTALEGSFFSFFFEYTLVPVGKVELLSGNFPSTLTLDQDTGQLSGTLPFISETTQFNFTLRIRNENGIKDRSFSLTITNQQALWLTDPVIQDGSFGSFVQNQEIDFQLEIFNPTEIQPTYELIGGSLPNGTFLTSDGKIKGFITDNPKTFRFQIRANTIPAIVRTFSLQVSSNKNRPPYWATLDGWIGDILDGEFFSFDLKGKDFENASLTYTFKSGNLPNGISLSPSGEVFGIPSFNTVGNNFFTVTIDDGNRQVDRTFLLRVNAVFNEFEIFPVSGIGFNENYEATLLQDYPSMLQIRTQSASRWVRYVSLGTLPDGLTLDINTGDIAGRPITTGSFIFTVKAFNFEGFEKEITVTIAVQPNFALQPNKVYATIVSDDKLKLFNSITNYKIPYEKLYRPGDKNFSMFVPELMIQRYATITANMVMTKFQNKIASILEFEKTKIVPVQDNLGRIMAYAVVAIFNDPAIRSDFVTNIDAISQFLYQNGAIEATFEPWHGLEYVPNIGANTFTIHDHGKLTGDLVIFNNQDVPSPFFNGVPYFVIVLDENTIRLAQTKEAAEIGDFISFNVNERSRPGVLQTRIIGIPLTYINTTDIDLPVLPQVHVYLERICVDDEMVFVDFDRWLR